MSAPKPAISEPPKAEPRRVVGLPSAVTSTKKPRRGGKKASVSVPALDNAAVEAPVPAATEDIAPVAIPDIQAEPLNGVTSSAEPTAVLDAESEEEEKRFSPVAVLQKRIKAHNKKLQRIATYEQEPDKLNPDQQKAVASKPGLELNIKELQELVVLFQAEEAEDEKRVQRRQAVIARKTQAQIKEAVEAHEAEAQVHLAFLLQFLHLRSLFTPEQSAFAPPSLPTVVANATPQEFGAVMTLFDELANGPLSGGGEDALQRIKHLYEGDPVEVVQGVDYGRIKQMIGQLTAPPAEVAAINGTAHLPEPEPLVSNETSAPPGFSNGPLGGISFMQASDISLGAAELEVARNAEATATPDADPFSKAGPAPTISPFDPPSSNWADDVDHPATEAATTSAALGLATAGNWGKQEQTETNHKPKVLDDGFQTVGGSATTGRGRGNRGFRGSESRGTRGNNNGERGRGGARGGARGPRPERSERPPTEGGEKLPRAEAERARGRGMGRGRGRGRGAPGGPRQSAAPTEAAA